MHLCSFPDCNRKYFSHNYCSKHSWRFLKYGTPHLPEKTKEIRLCSVLGCNKKYKGKGYCVMHLYRFKRYGTTYLPKRIKKPKKIKLCSVHECTRKLHAKGLCSMHRLRLKKYGEVGQASSTKGDRGTGHISETTGYRYFYKPSHPNAGRNGQIAEHTIIMSKILGRPLEKKESVHHKNGIKLDNSPENLELRVSVHPNGQDLLDVANFCIKFLKEHKNDIKIMKKLSTNNLPAKVWC